MDQNMEVYYKANYLGAYEINYTIEQMLDDCGDDCYVEPPLALFAYETNDLDVTFFDLSVSETSNIVEWNWDFGDGTTSQEQNPTHSYGIAGTYYVTLDVVDHYGANGIQYWEYINLEGTSSCEVELGDVTGDGGINILDIVQIANYVIGLSEPEYECAADYNQDGNVNILDIVNVANHIIGN